MRGVGRIIHNADNVDAACDGDVCKRRKSYRMFFSAVPTICCNQAVMLLLRLFSVAPLSNIVSSSQSSQQTLLGFFGDGAGVESLAQYEHQET